MKKTNQLARAPARAKFQLAPNHRIAANGSGWLVGCIYNKTIAADKVGEWSNHTHLFVFVTIDGVVYFVDVGFGAPPCSSFFIYTCLSFSCVM
jgi:hypothetical protein